MNNPRNIISHISIWLVSLICLPLAALLLLIPLHRLITPMWPAAIEEHRFSDGSIQLRQAGARGSNYGLLRSHPLSAAILDLSGGDVALGYVIAMRSQAASDSEDDSAEMEIAVMNVPNQPFWQPADYAAEGATCKLALSEGEEVPRWLACDSIHRVVLPNRLTLMQKLEVALARLDDPAPRNPAEADSVLQTPVVEMESSAETEQCAENN